MIIIAVVMQKIGLFTVLGIFLYGVVRAESKFRHKLEVNTEPFKDLLLALFFITVGVSIDFPLVLDELTLITLLVLSLIIIKASVLYVLYVLYVLSRIFNLQKNNRFCLRWH